MKKQVTYTEVEADALVAKAKKLAQESGRTVRAEAELLLRDRETRLRDLRDKVVEASELLAAIIVELNDLRAESGDDDGELAAVMATMATSCEPFTGSRRVVQFRPQSLPSHRRHRLQPSCQRRSKLSRPLFPESAGRKTIAGSGAELSNP